MIKYVCLSGCVCMCVCVYDYSSLFLLFCVSSFSLLLLEPGEIYFEDYAAVYTFPLPENKDNNEGWHVKFEDGFLRGRLKVREFVLNFSSFLKPKHCSLLLSSKCNKNIWFPAYVFLLLFLCVLEFVTVNIFLVKHNYIFQVCSKSLVFDPRDLRAPIIKFPLRAVETIVEGQATSSHPA